MIAPLFDRQDTGAVMKRKYGAALKRESLAEQRMREAAKAAGNNSFNYGSDLRKGAITRGKRRSRADLAGK
jgi:hypothetical protein